MTRSHHISHHPRKGGLGAVGRVRGASLPNEAWRQSLEESPLEESIQIAGSSRGGANKGPTRSCGARAMERQNHERLPSASSLFNLHANMSEEGVSRNALSPICSLEDCSIHWQVTWSPQWIAVLLPPKAIPREQAEECEKWCRTARVFHRRWRFHTRWFPRVCR